jgi:hypothetical protein
MLNERGRYNRFGCMCNFIFIHSSPSSINIGVSEMVVVMEGGLRAVPSYNVCESAANCLHATELYGYSQESSVPS